MEENASRKLEDENRGYIKVKRKIALFQIKMKLSRAKNVSWT